MKYLKIITTIIIIFITFATLSTKAQAVMFKYDAAGNMVKRVADVVCYADLTIPANASNATKLQRLYTSSGTIKTQSFTTPKVDVLVRKNEIVEFRADHIELKPGFSVETNASFKADIEPCEQ